MNMGHSEDQAVNAQPHAVNAGRMNQLAIWEKKQKNKRQYLCPSPCTEFQWGRLIEKKKNKTIRLPKNMDENSFMKYWGIGNPV